MTTVEILCTARALVAREGGWCRKKYRVGSAYCASGALSAASNRDQDYYRAESYLCVAAGAKTYLETWNDAESRTQAEVVAAFDRAIDLASVVCGARCAHGWECLMLAGHVPTDRHETQHGCVFFDVAEETNV